MPVNVQELILQNSLRIRIEKNMILTQTALVKIFTVSALKTFNDETKSSSVYPSSFFEPLSLDFSHTDVDKLCDIFLDILHLPFGNKRIDDTHKSYIQTRTRSRELKKNHRDALFAGTSTRSYKDGFSNHAYTFAYYLSKNRDNFSTEELKAVLDLFYYGYIKKDFHSFCEIHAAFLRASENFGYPELRVDDLLAPSPLALQHPGSPNLQSHQQTFNALLARLLDETETIVRKGTTNSRYKAVKTKATTLYQNLSDAGKAFFKNTPTSLSLKQFATACETEINMAMEEFKKHRSLWSKLHPILKGILGVLALITIVPAVVVAVSSSYVQTFFGSSLPNSAKKLGLFRKDLISNVDQISQAFQTPS